VSVRNLHINFCNFCSTVYKYDILSGVQHLRIITCNFLSTPENVDEGAQRLRVDNQPLVHLCVRDEWLGRGELPDLVGHGRGQGQHGNEDQDQGELLHLEDDDTQDKTFQGENLSKYKKSSCLLT
jgi:Zn-finger nucleic acid-binding protein